jgi:type IV secretory pathway TraG/TraD family ATPase VirD4
LCLLMLQTVLFIINCKVTAKYDTYVLGKYIAAKYVNGSSRRRPMIFKNRDGSISRTTARTIAKKNPWIKETVDKELRRIGLNWLYLFISTASLYPLLIMFFSRKSKKQTAKRHIRGAKIITPEEFNEQSKERDEELDLPLGSIRMPVNNENRQSLAIGKPGVGKSVLFKQTIPRLYERKEFGIMYDNKGEYYSSFFDPENDLLFNPLDQRSLGWNIFNELKNYPDVDAVAASLIPPSISNTDPFWNDAARGVFSGCLHYLFQNDMRNNRHLWQILTAEPQELAQKLSITKGGEAGYRYITQNVKNSRQAESVLAVMMQYTKCFEYMAGNEGGFSINDWLKGKRGFIYITNYEDIEETLRPILSLFVDLVGRKILSLPDDIDRRIFIFLDEFGSLQRLSTIGKLLTRGRSKGASVNVGIQDDGQLEKIYGAQTRKSYDNAFGNRFTFALTGETAEREAKYNIGEVEYREIERSLSMGPHDMRDGVNIGEQKKRDLLMLPSEIANLPDLTALVKLKNYDFVLSRWQWQPTAQLHEPFVLREDLNLEQIVAEQKEISEKAARLKELEREMEANSLELQEQKEKVRLVINCINQANKHRFKGNQKSELNALQNALYEIRTKKISNQAIIQSELFPEGTEEAVTIEGIESRLQELGWTEA